MKILSTTPRRPHALVTDWTAVRAQIGHTLKS